ncbi:MAG: L-histidine N(alpha)-methyltransferase [Pseudomonadota bacterium]|jgi:dimethylhistidine N-methyltransferase
MLEFHGAEHIDQERLKAEAIAGLTAPAANLPPKFFYDELGSKLFEAITALPEYQVTRLETALVSKELGALSRMIPQHACLVDLGAGNCQKAVRWFDTIHPSVYLAMDIAVGFMRPCLQKLAEGYPEIRVVGFGTDFARDFPHATVNRVNIVGAPVVYFYPGSSIGNFSPESAHSFLAGLRQTPRFAGLLIGVDLLKPEKELVAAYDDPLGVTASFNKNILMHLNRLLDANFVLENWQHVALFDSTHGRIEMHLESRVEQSVTWRGGGHRKFQMAERIHTENSYKYDLESFADLLMRAGYSVKKTVSSSATGVALYWAT